jgi:hypothetical protein
MTAHPQTKITFRLPRPKMVPDPEITSSCRRRRPRKDGYESGNRRKGRAGERSFALAQLICIAQKDPENARMPALFLNEAQEWS